MHNLSCQFCHFKVFQQTKTTWIYIVFSVFNISKTIFKVQFWNFNTFIKVVNMLIFVTIYFAVFFIAFIYLHLYMFTAKIKTNIYGVKVFFCIINTKLF